MPDNTLLKRIFSSSAIEDADSFDLSSRARRQRMAQILAILRRHKVLNSLSPEEFRAMLEDLGPSFVKIGQTLSTRSEILPQIYCDELAKLQADCEPMTFDEVLAALDIYLDGKRTEIFSTIDPTPLGSASLAQVHRARLSTGEEVAIKVQRPGVKETMALDIDIMRMLARRATKVMKTNQMVDIQGVVEEMWGTFLRETDFRKEAENLRDFSELNKNCVFIGSPCVYPQYCTEYVLVMEYIDGISIKDTTALKAAGYDLEEIGLKLLDNYASQILDHGFFHADPHPGNIIIRGGKIIYIDLGIMGRLSARDRMGFGQIISAVGTRDPSALKDALLSFAISKDNTKIDHPRFLADLDDLLETYASADINTLDIGAMLNDLITLARSCYVTLPNSVTNIARGVVTIEGTVADFVGNQSIVAIINDHIERTTDAASTLATAIEDLALALRASGKGTLEAFAYSGDVMKMLAHGQLRMNMEMSGSEEPFRKLSNIFSRIALGMIVAGLFVGSSLLALSSMEPRVLGVPLLAATGYVGALVLSLWVIIDTIRRS